MCVTPRPTQRTHFPDNGWLSLHDNLHILQVSRRLLLQVILARLASRSFPTRINDLIEKQARAWCLTADEPRFITLHWLIYISNFSAWVFKNRTFLVVRMWMRILSGLNYSTFSSVPIGMNIRSDGYLFVLNMLIKCGYNGLHSRRSWWIYNSCASMWGKSPDDLALPLPWKLHKVISLHEALSSKDK